VPLRILGGQSRGRTLKTLPQDNLSIRPMLWRMKKSVFDIIQNRIADSYFLDLYAGVGSVGIEALSRGAKKAVFAELSPVSINLIKKNIEMLGYEDKAQIIECDVIRNFERLKDKYDIVFMGPPYKDMDKKALALTCPTLRRIVSFDILKEDSLLISQRHIKEPVTPIAGLELFRNEKYGDTIVSFYKRRIG
jgi:16S rRNA (guanine(966)-N(2))-methyltransferase RsmD